MPTPHDTFELRFKRPQTRAALEQIAAAEGISLTDAAERAIEHEVALLGLDVERRLTEALAGVPSYTAADTEDYLAAIAAGERAGLGPMRDVTAAASASAPVPWPDPHGVLAAFARH